MRVVLDTNVFVAAGFNRNSSSARIIQRIRGGELELVWDGPTLRETRKIVKKIPPLTWKKFEDLFTEERQFVGETHPEDFGVVADYDDRKFAALAAASNAILITNDEHLLSVRDVLDIDVQTPGEFG